MTRRVLVAGVGNLFLGDDAFGSEVARRLAGADLPAGTEVRDYGIGGVHLAYDLLNGYDGLLLIDTVPRGGEPGTVYTIEVTAEDLEGGSVDPHSPVDPHSMDPGAVLASLQRLDGELPRTLLVGCEPADTSQRMGLSPDVTAAVEVAARTVREILAEQFGLDGRGSGPRPARECDTKHKEG